MGPDEDEFPPPLRPTKIPRPVTMEPMGQKFQCCVCRTKEGILTCTRCKSVRYCEKTCQKKQWSKHKIICAKIKETFEETERTANIMKSFKESPDSEPVDLFDRYFNGVEYVDGVDYVESMDEVNTYETSRRDLIYVLEKCGESNFSELAYDLAAGNLMDMMLFKYREYWNLEGVREDLAALLVNANLDQEAYDYLRYFYIREQSQEALPYLSIESQDIETPLKKSDIGNLALVDIINIALLKYKRMRHIEFQELCETIRFKNFMMGTHPNVGKNSAVIKIRGVSLIIDTLSKNILKPWKNRVKKLHNDIEILLQNANKNQYVIPGILDPESVPEIDHRPMWINDQGEVEGDATDEEQKDDFKVRDAHVTVEKTTRAWTLAMMWDEGFLKKFLNEGRLPKPSAMPRLQLLAIERSKGRECNINKEELYRFTSLFPIPTDGIWGK